MNTKQHHYSLFTGDLERSLALFKDILGFTELWRTGAMGGRGMAALFGLESIQVELVMLRGAGHGLLELIHLLEPRPEPAPAPPALPAPAAICLEVDDIEGLHQRLEQAGWAPLTPVSQVPTPDGGMMRVFCIRTEENVLLEFIQML